MLHLLTQSLHLRDSEAGIVSNHHDLRGFEHAAQLSDGLRFGRSIHCKLFGFDGCPRVVCGKPPVATAVPLEVHANLEQGDVQPARRFWSCDLERLSEVRTKPAQPCELRKLGSRPRLCWPPEWD